VLPGAAVVVRAAGVAVLGAGRLVALKVLRVRAALEALADVLVDLPEAQIAAAAIGLVVAPVALARAGRHVAGPVRLRRARLEAVGEVVVLLEAALAAAAVEVAALVAVLRAVGVVVRVVEEAEAAVAEEIVGAPEAAEEVVDARHPVVVVGVQRRRLVVDERHPVVAVLPIVAITVVVAVYWPSHAVGVVRRRLQAPVGLAAAEEADGAAKEGRCKVARTVFALGDRCRASVRRGFTRLAVGAARDVFGSRREENAMGLRRQNRRRETGKEKKRNARHRASPSSLAARHVAEVH